MPQYRYAYDESDQLVDVLQLPQDRLGLNSQYLCIDCSQPLTAKTKGEKREKHFAHKNVSAVCTEETYLHKLAKQTFYDEYLYCLEHNEPFSIELSHPKTCSKYFSLLGQPCHLGFIAKSHDLTQYYDSIKLEERDGSFIPDLLIYRSGNEAQKIYVEIAVTHFLSQEKATSSNRIIEIPIETEADVDKIRRRSLSESDASFVNFDRTLAAVTDAECTCARRAYYCLLIYESGKSFMMHATLDEIEAQRRKVGATIQYARLKEASLFEDPLDKGLMFVELIEEAQRRGFRVRNCFLCRFAGENWSLDATQPIFCKTLKKVCNSNEAVGCKRFWVRPEYETSSLHG